MSLNDLLWACPACGLDKGLAPDPAGGRRTARHDVVCRGCGAGFDRVDGAMIRAAPAGHALDGPPVRSPAAWVAALPAPASYLEGRQDGEVVREASVEASRVVAEKVIRGAAPGRGDYLNRIETYGDPEPGRLELTPTALTWSPETAPQAAGEGPQREGPVRWSLDDLRAVQASSRSLQVAAAGHPLTSFRFFDDAVFFWELLIQEALRARYRAAGRGEITEFQPRITTR